MSTERIVCGQAPEIRQKSGGPARIWGYAAVFHREGDASTEFVLWDGLVERIAPGAFDRSLKESSDVVALRGHDTRQPLGRVSAGNLEVSVDKVGLRYDLTLPETNAGRDTAEEVRQGIVTGSSFGFDVPDGGAEYSRDKERGVTIRTLVDLDLVEVSPVTFEAYSGTSVMMRSALDDGQRDRLRSDISQAEAIERAAARQRRLREVCGDV